MSAIVLVVLQYLYLYLYLYLPLGYLKVETSLVVCKSSEKNDDHEC